MPHLAIAPKLTSALALVCLAASPTAATITVDTGATGKPISPLIYGSQIPWPRQGAGTLESTFGRLNQPLKYSPLVLEKAREMKLSTLRFHGDNVYNFRDGIGPFIDRPARPFSYYSNTIWANDYGTDEFISVCRAIQAEPVIVAPYLAERFHTATAPIGDQLCANWVEYCNGESPGLAYGQQQGWQPTTFTPSTQGFPAWQAGKQYHVGDKVRVELAPGALYQCIQSHKASDANCPGYDNRYITFWKWLPAEEIAVPGKSWLSTAAAPKGYFAWLREYYGHAEPYNVKYWEIGNEVHAWWGRTPRNPWAEPTAYRDNFIKIVNKMKAVDPTIKCGIAVPGPRYSGWRNYYSSLIGWTQGVLGTPGSYSAAYNAADFIIWHVENSPDEPNLTNPNSEYTQLFAMQDQLEQVTRPFMQDYPKPVMITESNVKYGLYFGADEKYQVHSHRLKSGLAVARLMNVYMRLGMMAVHQIYFAEAGDWWESKLMRMVFDDTTLDGRRRTGVTPTYLVLKLYSTMGRGDLLPVSLDGQSNLDAVAVRSSPEGAVRLFVVNKSPSAAESATVDLKGFTPEAAASVYTVNSSAGMEAYNEDNPSTVQIKQTALNTAASTFTYLFPAHSLTVIDLSKKAASQSPSSPSASPIDMRVTSDTGVVQPGQTVTYTIACKNKSAELITQTDVSFDIPAGTDYVTGSAVPSGVYSETTSKVTWTLSGLQPGETRNLRCAIRIR